MKMRILRILSMCATAGLLTGCATVLQQLQFTQPSLSLETEFDCDPTDSRAPKVDLMSPGWGS